MDKTNAKKIADYIFNDVFQVPANGSIEVVGEKYASDIPQPKKEACFLSHNPTWTSYAAGHKIASQEAIELEFKKSEWMKKYSPLSSMRDVLTHWNKINYITGERNINSKNVYTSDGIYNSTEVYHSLSIFDSKNIMYSYKIFDSNYMLASRDDTSCVLGIRMKECIFCSSGFEISWSNKISRSMFIHDCYDLYECLFCSHIRSKKYCIANMQFSKDEYFKTKKMVIKWILN